MVLAEIPFWVVHSLSSQGANSLMPKSPSEHPDKKEFSISETIKVLSGTAARCAIYSVDIHPDGSRFATAGGDGKVRIWACKSVFDESNQRKKRGVFGRGGGYVSSSSSSGGSIDEEHDVGIEMNEETKDAQHEQPHDDASTSIENTTENKIEIKTHENKEKSEKTNATIQSSRSSDSNKKRRITLQQVSPESTKAPKTSSNHRLLSSLSSHTGSVLCVRWSHSGTFLASSGDDAHILIYKRSTSQNHSMLQTGNLLSSTEEEQVEHWSRIRTLRGHNLDAVGIAWAPDDSHLVSCSLDSENPIIVWKLDIEESNEELKSQYHRKHQTQPILHPFKVLGRDIHKSTVKGIVFDPAGKYIASSGDDPAICIWRAWDDWGLEARIDSESGIFRSMKSESVTDLSLFRRLSFAPDGTHLCSTNSVLRSKNIAAMVTRNGWNVKSPAEGGVSLVGHKQPIVSSRHCPYFLTHDKRDNDSKKTDEEEDIEPDYAMLLALGDKKGFVTVWSTKSKRPIFKLQCSETRCTITDLSWGRSQNRDVLWLYVSMLDGHIVTLQFRVKDDVPNFLPNVEHALIFRLKYGIQVEEDGMKMKGVVCGSRSKLIENVLQYTLEEEEGHTEEHKSEDLEKDIIKTRQVLTIKSGKKRIKPVHMNPDEGLENGKNKMASNASDIDKNNKGSNATQDRNSMRSVLDNALQAANKAESMPSKQQNRQGFSPGLISVYKQDTPANNQTNPFPPSGSASSFESMVLSYSSNTIYSVDLDVSSPTQIGFSSLDSPIIRVTADCTNRATSCLLSISRNGTSTWKDILLNSRCTCLSGSKQSLVVGTSDGIIYSYATSPSTGFQSGMAFRAHPPLILGSPIANIQLFANEKMLVITANGNFAIYDLLEMKLVHKNSILPALSQMRLSANSTLYPKLARAQITPSDHFVIILSLNQSPSGNLQAFVYSRDMELWYRVADGSYALSEFYSSLPKNGGILSQLHNAIYLGGSGASNTYQTDLGDSDAEYIISRSHCEDRMSCTIALKSRLEFQFWLRMYARRLGKEGEEYRLRVLIDLLLDKDMIKSGRIKTNIECWWLSSASTILGLEKKKLMKIVIDEMGKNRALQRLTSELTMEMESMEI